MVLQRINVARCLSLVGAHLVMAPFAFIWYYGNLSAYMDSYFMYGCSTQCYDGDTQWIMSLYILGTPLGIYLIEPMKRKLGIKASGVISMLAGGLALFGIAYTLQSTVIGTASLAGIVLGPSAGATLGVAIAYVHLWAPDDTSLFTATTTGFSALLAFGENELITYYVNPDNLEPDVDEGEKTYFSQTELLNRVPTIIMILAGITFGCQLTGYLLITAPKPYLNLSSEENGYKVKKQAPEKNWLGKDPLTFSEYGTTQDVRSPQPLSFPDYDKSPSDSVVVCDTHPPPYDEDSSHTSSESSTIETIKPRVENFADIRSWKPIECVKTKQFWAIFLCSVSLSYCMTILNNYYKQFGLIYIPNDSFLTLVGSIMPIISFASRSIFGYLMDKGYLTIQDAMVLPLATMALLSAFWYFSAQVDQYLYMFLIWILASAHALFYVVIPEAALKLFGPEYFNINYAMLFSACIPVGLFSALVVTDIINALGWFWLFVTISALNAVSLVPVVLFNFRMVK